MDIHEILKSKVTDAPISIPAIVQNRINYTTENIETLSQRKQELRNPYKVLISTASFMLIICVLGVGFPSFASNIPLANTVFSYFYDTGILGTEYLKYSTNVNLSAYSNGKEITISEILYDGTNMAISYQVSSDGDIKTELPKTIIFASEQCDMKINNKTVNFTSNLNTLKLVDRKTLKGVIQYEDVSSDKYSDQFKLEINLTSIQIDSVKVKGNWNFKMIVKNNCAQGTKEIKLNSTFKIYDNEILIDKIRVTPVTSTMNFKYIKRGTKDFQPYYDLIYDDRGNPLQFRNGRGDQNGFMFELVDMTRIPNAISIVPLVDSVDGFNMDTTFMGNVITSDNTQFRLDFAFSAYKDKDRMDIQKEIENYTFYDNNNEKVKIEKVDYAFKDSWIGSGTVYLKKSYPTQKILNIKSNKMDMTVDEKDRVSGATGKSTGSVEKTLVNLPIELYDSIFGKITVTNLVYENGKAKLYYSIEGKAPTEYRGSIQLGYKGESDEFNYIEGNRRLLSRNGDKAEYVIIYPKIDQNKKLAVRAFKDYLQILEDQKITVKIN